jgi:hypothetical protein
MHHHADPSAHPPDTGALTLPDEADEPRATWPAVSLAGRLARAAASVAISLLLLDGVALAFTWQADPMVAGSRQASPVAR